MAQPSPYTMPPQQQQRPNFSPQSTITPAPTSQLFDIQPHKRQRVSPNPPTGLQSPYPMSNPSTPSPSNGSNTPVFSNISIPQNAFNTNPNPTYNSSPYSNGNTNMNNGGLNLPQHSGSSTPQYQQSSPSFQMANPLGANQPPFNNYPMNQQGGVMGPPPSKPLEKAKEDGVDPMDVLGGTGIDLREEEQFSYYRSYSDFQQPGDSASFYGAGPLNAGGETPGAGISQDQYNQELADRAWERASQNLAVSRQRELNNPFLNVGLVHTRMSKISRDNGLALNIDPRSQAMGTMALPDAFTNRTVRINSVDAPPDGLIVTTNGNFIPFDSMLVDQLALLSIATKHRLRTLLENANRLTIGRQTGSHGLIPGDWVEAAAPSNNIDSSAVVSTEVRSGFESAVSPESNSLKRPFSEMNGAPNPAPESVKASGSTPKIINQVVSALRDAAKIERDQEEARLRKRAARDASKTPGTPSVVPGTPGSVAPDDIKAPSKKDLKKKAAEKVTDAASHAAANQTTSQFLGGGSSLFGKKKKGGYSWMNAGAAGSGSGASTPGRIAPQSLLGTPAPAVPSRLTAEAVRRLGGWREDKDKGMKIQLRDWIAVLDEDGHEKKALQKAYATSEAV